MEGGSTLYGLIGQLKAASGKRDALIAILLESGRDAQMPGCLSYQIAKDVQDPDIIWVTEVWETQEHHKQSLNLPSVQEAISKARPIIAGFGLRFETEPVL